MSESTNRVIGDTSPLVPRVLEKGVVTFSALTAYGTQYRSTASVTLYNVESRTNPIIDCYFASTVDGTDYNIYKMSFTGVFSTGLPATTANHYIDTTTYNSKSVIRLNFQVTDYAVTGYIYKAYYVVYSSGFTDEVVF